LRLRAQGAVDAHAEPGVLELTYNGPAAEVTFEVCAPATAVTALTRTHWELPGVRVALETNASDFVALERTDGWALCYRVGERPARFRLAAVAFAGEPSIDSSSTRTASAS